MRRATRSLLVVLIAVGGLFLGLRQVARPLLLGEPASHIEFPGVVALTTDKAGNPPLAFLKCTGVLVEDPFEKGGVPVVLSTKHCDQRMNVYPGRDRWFDGAPFRITSWTPGPGGIIAARACQQTHLPRSVLVPGPPALPISEALTSVGWNLEANATSGSAANWLRSWLVPGTAAKPGGLIQNRRQSWVGGAVPSGTQTWETDADGYRIFESGDCGSPLFASKGRVAGVMIDDYARSDAAGASTGAIFTLSPPVYEWLRTDPLPACP